MKTIKKIVLGLLLMMFASMAQAWKIEVFLDHQVIYLPETLNNSNVKIIVNNRSVALGSLGNDIVIKYVIAQSGVLGYGVDSIAKGVWDQSIETDGAWRVPISADKDNGVTYGLIDTNGNVYKLDTHSYAAQAVSGDVKITNVTQDEMSGAVSYRFKGFAKAGPSIEYITWAYQVKVSMGTSIFYGAKANTLYGPKVRRLTKNEIDRFELREDNNVYVGSPRIDAEGNLIAYLNSPRPATGTLWIITNDGQEYEFASATWKNGLKISMLIRIKE